MVDVLGYRAKIAVLVPATNTIVEPELHAMAPRGVTVHTGRFSVGQRDLRLDQPEQNVLDDICAAFEPSITQIARSAPNHLILGFSAPSYWGGREGSLEFGRRLEVLAGLPVTTGAGALDNALRTLGARRVAVLTPYAPAITERVQRFLEQCGHEVVATLSMDVPGALEIATVGDQRIRTALLELNRAEPDAIVQSGTNLSMAGLADEAERWLGRPVLAINSAMFWDALRRVGIPDRVNGFGRLLREH
jgi:maleate isomerase